jgi:ZPR1 zinc-finger domain
MATTCDLCGYKSNEVKSGSCMSEKGKKITFAFENANDLSRDILKVIVFLLNVVLYVYFSPRHVVWRFPRLDSS